MSEFFDSAANQQRTRMLVMNAMTAVRHPLVDQILGTAGARNPEIGWGLKEYRSGESCLSTSPIEDEESAAETTYYPTIGSIGLTGAIYAHGEGSNALRVDGEIVSMYMNDELVEGRYTNYMAVFNRPSGLVVGQFDRPTQQIDPVTNEVFDTNESGLATLLDHLRAL